jgi:tRNA nucleotidyltransferase/poly(A) polymerase
MLYEDEDDFFVGSPRSKFFDIMFNANKNLVEDALEKHVERHVAMEMILAKLIEEKGMNLEAEISTIRVEKQDEIHHAKMDFFIATVGDILTQNE